MANVGIIQRRDKKSKLIKNRPLIGETVFATDTEEYGALEHGELVWRKFRDSVTSVSGKTGDITLNKSDVGLSNVDNTSDLDKPVSIATQNLINSIISNIDPNNITKEKLGLGNVDNTSDLDKPVSTATQEALDLKLDKTGIAYDTQRVNGIPSTDIASKEYTYSKTEIDDKLSLKANLNSVYTELEIDNFLNNKADKSNTYTKTESDNLFELKDRKAQPNGYASLDKNGKIPIEQLTQLGVEGYDDYLSFPVVGKNNTIYIDKSTPKLYIYDKSTQEYKAISGISGDVSYKRTTPTEISVGGVDVGTIFTGTISDALDKILYPYIQPYFASFSVDLPSKVEIGYTIPAGVHTFSWLLKEENNVVPLSISIEESGNELASSLDNTGNTVIQLPSYQKNVITNQQFTIKATDVKNVVFSKTYTVHWLGSILYGQNTLETVTSDDIANLNSDLLSNTFKHTYDIGMNGYKWICYPKFMGLANLFKDAKTNFNVAMNAPETVSVTTDTGLILDYYCYRTTNQMVQSIKIIVE